MTGAPTYTPDDLEALSPDALIELLTRDEDRVPRVLIEACAARGDTLFDRLEEILAHGRGWSEDATDGDWWLLLHAVMILGLIPGSRAGRLLIAYIRKTDAVEDHALQEWFCNDLPALFANKPAEVIGLVRELASDQTLDWYVRISAQDVLLAQAHAAGTLERELDAVAAIAASEEEEWTLRMLCAQHLVDFPRERHRALLMDLARREKDHGRTLGAEEIDEAYAAGVDRPEWAERGDPWAFYDAQAIAERQQRWAKEAEDALARGGYDEDDQDDDGGDWSDERVETYVRPGPKVGRNDLCPCGSGRKYKRCCMPA